MSAVANLAYGIAAGLALALVGGGLCQLAHLLRPMLEPLALVLA